ncbi:hypothetical protein [Exiguobacterium aurantiacum]|uniref:hypothetical protein n=1 Tax=Exiguobacterium aurantiacum TaxID=33987 RepID=UPI00384D1FF9
MLLHYTLMRLLEEEKALKEKEAAPAPVTPKPQPKKAKPKAKRVTTDAPAD